MKDDQFEKYLDDSINNFMSDYIDDPEASEEPHEFSKKFNRKMNKLIKKKKRFPAVRTPFRKAIAVTATVTVMSLTLIMSVGAWRNAFFRFVTEPFSTHTNVKVKESGSDPETIEENYEPAYIPDGFTADEKYDFNDTHTRTYVKNGDYIKYSQRVRSNYNSLVNTEGYDMIPVSVNGCDGFEVDMYNIGMYLLTWDSGEYIFEIVGTVDKDEIMRIADSIQKSE